MGSVQKWKDKVEKETFVDRMTDQELPQAKITINLLCQANADPSKSTYAYYMCGPFGYNKMPLAQMGCRVQIHEKSNQQGVWAYHSVDDGTCSRSGAQLPCKKYAEQTA